MSRLGRANEITVVELVSGRRAVSAPRCFASLSTLAAISFLFTYMGLHALHVSGRDPKFVQLLSEIPLFACSGTAALAGILFAVSCRLAGLDHERLLCRMPKILALSVALFALEIAFFP